MDYRKYQLYSIGYGNRRIADFLSLLEKHQIEVLVDVRSYPDKAYISHYRRKYLKEHLNSLEVEYEFMGDKLGGMPDDPTCYVDDEVNYELTMQTDFFKNGIRELLRLAEGKNLVYMCAEMDENRCHRKHLVAKYLEAEYNIKTHHINKHGQITQVIDLFSSM